MMTKRTRYFMAGSVAVLVAGLGTGLIAYYGGGFPSLAASHTGPAELSYLPADATVIGFANVREVMDSSLRQRLKQAVPAQENGRLEFQEHTGIDVERDIDYVVAALTPSAAADANGLVVARGRFNVTKLESVMREHGGVVEEYKGKRLVTVDASHRGRDGVDDSSADATRRRGHGRLTLAFLEPGLVGIGSDVAIKSAIDAQLTAHSITSRDDMMQLVSEIERGNNAWAVGRFDALASHAHLPENVSSRIPQITNFAVMSHIDGGLTGTLRADTRDDQAAENLRDVVRGFLALGKMQSQNNPQVSAMMQSLQLTGTGKTVALSFQVPADVFNLIHGHGDGAPQPRH